MLARCWQSSPPAATFLDMRQTWLGRLLETGAASPAERRLADQRGADFFTWFHLEPVADPAVSVAHGTWHAFRPTGEVVMRRSLAREGEVPMLRYTLDLGANRELQCDDALEEACRIAA